MLCALSFKTIKEHLVCDFTLIFPGLQVGIGAQGK